MTSSAAILAAQVIIHSKTSKIRERSHQHDQWLADILPRAFIRFVSISNDAAAPCHHMTQTAQHRKR